MKSNQQEITNWGNYPTLAGTLYTPATTAEITDLVGQNPQILARGNGRCYGDAALGTHLISTLKHNKILSFDKNTGEIECESGVLLFDILKVIVPDGWFFQVTPGIKYITVGGAIACDVHGKNHPTAGCFSNYLIHFDLLQADGTIIRCSKTEHVQLFWQTCGGMGWTGIVLSAKFKLMKINSLYMEQRTVSAPNIQTLLNSMEANRNIPYAAAWIDSTAKGAALGRGVAFFADHVQGAKRITPVDLQQMLNGKSRDISFWAPDWLLNKWTIRAYNALFRFKNKDSRQTIDLNTYFYPLDKLTNWNRLYGRRGFIQYQFCLPESSVREGLPHILQTIQDSPETPFLTVLKRHGERPPEAIHSFPVFGYSLALDFPRTPTIFELVKRLDLLLDQYGGKIYLAKDACSAPHLGRVDPRTFGNIAFHSALKERITVV